jgi:uncharacterized membrane protein
MEEVLRDACIIGGSAMIPVFWVKLYLFTIPVFFAIDMIWLGFVARNFLQNQPGAPAEPRGQLARRLCLLFHLYRGILLFAVRPGLEAQSLARACLWGALFGFFTYATYDLTNLATLRDWPMVVVVVDIAWGTVLCTLVAAGSYLIGMRLG